MSLRVLVVDSTIVTSDRVIERGYVYVEGRYVKALGEGDPPEDYQLADTLIGGEGRVVLPAPAALLVAPEAYAFRQRGVSVLDMVTGRVRALLEDDDELSYYSSLMGFYELSMQGYGLVVALALNHSTVSRALADSGLQGVVVIPLCGLNWRDAVSRAEEARRELGAGRGVGVAACGDGEVGAARRAAEEAGADLVAVLGPDGARIAAGRTYIDVSYSMLSPSPSPATMSAVQPWLSVNRQLNPHADRALEALMYTPYRVLRGTTPLTPGGEAFVLVVDGSEPPSMVVDPQEAVHQLATSTPRTETLISAGNIVVDGGQHLYVGSEACRRAREVIGSRLGRLREAIR